MKGQSKNLSSNAFVSCIFIEKSRHHFQWNCNSCIKNDVNKSYVILVSVSLWLGANAQGKRGLCYGNITWANYFAGNPEVTWGYNWGVQSGGLDSSVEYVPMLWSVPREVNPNFKNAAAAAKNVLGFNEPDLNSQANTIPSVAAAGYQTYMQPLAGKSCIGYPAVTNAGNGVLAYMGLGGWITSSMIVKVARLTLSPSLVCKWHGCQLRGLFDPGPQSSQKIS